jgi:hypothetical protein
VTERQSAAGDGWEDNGMDLYIKVATVRAGTSDPVLAQLERCPPGVDAATVRSYLARSATLHGCPPSAPACRCAPLPGTGDARGSPGRSSAARRRPAQPIHANSAQECTKAVGATEAASQARAGWWRAWLARFGLAELCGTVAALASFTAGYLAAGSLLTAAGLATICETIGFYGCIAAKTAVAARQDTADLAGWRRLAAGIWHAITEQLASCAAAEALDGFLVRPGCLAGAAWLAQPLPGGVWLGFALGKIAADLAWYAMEASARCGVARTLSAARHIRRSSPPSAPVRYAH